MIFFLFFCFNFTPFSAQFYGIQLLVATILSHRYNFRTGSGEIKVERSRVNNMLYDLPVVGRQGLGTHPESLVAQLTLRCSALDHCATRGNG